MADIRIEELADEISRAIKEYTEDVSEAIDRKITQVADQVLQETQRLSPKRTGNYARTWVKTSKTFVGGRKYIIWNKKNYRLVHLLEFGHAKQGGGRVAARPHLRVAHEKYGEKLPEHIKRIIRNGGGE